VLFIKDDFYFLLFIKDNLLFIICRLLLKIYHLLFKISSEIKYGTAQYTLPTFLILTDQKIIIKYI
jgi:hypothetical protein